MRGDDRGFVIDTVAIAVISVLICVASQRLALMSVAVPLVIVLRTVLWSWGMAAAAVRTEVAFLLVATVLGGFNDWNSVVRHRIYDYHVPSDVAWSTIPVWMLLYWGMILRYLATLAHWRRMGPTLPRDTVRLGSAAQHNGALKIGLALVLVLATRQAIYRLYLDPVWSWAPFAGALLAHAALFEWGRYERRLVGVFFVGGTLIEVLYIQVGSLHAYHLGWLGGVPLWIALWWCLGIVVWADLAPRLYGRVASLLGSGSATMRGHEPAFPA